MIILKPENDKIYFYNIKNTKDYSGTHKIHLKGFFNLYLENNVLSIENLYLEKDFRAISISVLYFIKALKKQNIIITKRHNMLFNFLNQHNISFNTKKICDFCLLKEKITLLDDYFFHTINRYYCKHCAIKYVSFSADVKSKSSLENLLENNQDLDFVLEHIEDNLLENKNLTLYDVIDSRHSDFNEIAIKELNIPSSLKKIIKNRMEYLFPVQVLALKSGLLENENLLIVSATASGKTLIGEIAGVTKALNHNKMIYLSPLVALANQKYYDFKEKYEQLGLNVALQVGSNRINSDEELFIKNQDIDNADIIIATYEGLDFILRSGRSSELNNLGTVIIDEMQMLEDEDRGHRLNGLINRLEFIFPSAQLIGLSATINNSLDIANKFGMKLVEYDGRPVKLERHLISYKDTNFKNKLIMELCKNEYKTISSKGFHGQTIIFTDSRRKCELISKYLNKNGIKSGYYHSGLSYSKRVFVEKSFINQDISTVVTTMALASGIDFPASLVIFETLRMGIDWISNNEFHQMIGRAGRPSYHDKGSVYLFARDKTINYDNEYEFAKDLLTGNVTNINVLFDSSDVYEEVLSDICAIDNINIEKLNDKYNCYLLPITFKEALNKLKELDMIEDDKKNQTYIPTEYGKAVSKSFINIQTAIYIKENIDENPLNLMTTLEHIHNVYINNRIFSINNENILSNNLFSDKNKELLSKNIQINKLNRINQNKLINFLSDFFNCNCKEKPYCNCLEKNISEHIIERRIQGWTPSEISKEFKREYNITIYSGDIYKYLDQNIRILESIRRIANAYENKHTSNNCEWLIKKIEG